MTLDEDCRQEWVEAQRKCRELFAEAREQAAGLRRRRSIKGVTGGYTDIDRCAKGLVSERCGGNGVQR